MHAPVIAGPAAEDENDNRSRMIQQSSRSPVLSRQLTK
jgi:hypothetical protein